MKRFTIPCDFAGQKAPFHIYIGSGPAPGCHPLKYQAHWLVVERGGSVPTDVMESFQKLLVIAEENHVGFEELTVYALRESATPASSPESSAISVPRHESDSTDLDANTLPLPDEDASEPSH